MKRLYGGEKVLAHQLEGALDRTSALEVRGSRWHDVASTTLRLTAGLILGLGIWQVMALIMNSNGSTLGFPYPLQTFERLGEYFFGGRSLYGHSIFEHLLASIRRLLIAFGLASAVGIILGSILGYFNRIYQIGMVPVAVYQMIPGLAWLPVAILLFGLGDASSMFIIFAVSSMVITIGVSSGIRMVPEVLVNAAKMSGASSLTVFTQVLIPQAAASIVNALRLGMSSAWRVLIAAEMVVGTGFGMGYSIQLSRDLMDYVGSFACITVICLFGLIVDRGILAGIERWMRSRLGMEGLS